MAIIPIIFFALLFGVGSFFGPTESSFSTEVTPAIPSSAEAPSKAAHSMFQYREPLPPCDSWQCLQDAVEQQGPAELVRTETTTEGDPVTTYYRVQPWGELEVFTDNSQDKFRGDPAWTYDVCSVPDDLRQGCPGS